MARVVKVRGHIREGKWVKPHFRYYVQGAVVLDSSKIKLKRSKKAEGLLVKFWFEDPKFGIIATLIQEPNNVHLRISTPKEAFVVGFPFAWHVTESEALNAALRALKERGYNL